MMKYLVTGGAGFIGSNITQALVRRGQRVRVFDNMATGKMDNLSSVADNIEFVNGDLADLDKVREACADVDIVLHQGALPSVPRSVRDPLTSNEKNVTGTLNVLVAARDAGVRRVVIASSSSVYGDTPVLPKVETMTPMPKSPYAVSKLTCEYYARVFWELYQLETVCLRYFNVFGPLQDPTSQYSAVIPKFIAAMMRGEAPTIYGDGEQSRDFTFVGDVVEANLHAATADGAAGEVMNFACNQRHTLNDLVRLLNRILGTDIPAVHADPRPGDVRHSQADVEKATRILGYKAQWSFEEGLRETVKWHQSQQAKQSVSRGGVDG